MDIHCTYIKYVTPISYMYITHTCTVLCYRYIGRLYCTETLSVLLRKSVMLQTVCLTYNIELKFKFPSIVFINLVYETFIHSLVFKAYAGNETRVDFNSIRVTVAVSSKEVGERSEEGMIHNYNNNIIRSAQ